MSRRLSQDQILTRFKEVHSNNYDYSMVDYKSYHKKVIIKCIKHDYVFEQNAANHLSGKGCALCGREKIARAGTISQVEVIENFKRIHMSRYDYSLVNYKGAKTKVKIICKIHGLFEQTPDAHCLGQGCPSCGNKSGSDAKTLNQNDVIKKFKKLHGDRYDYSLVKYTSAKNKVFIICKKHGVFKQTPHAHTRIDSPRGCPSCAKISSKMERKWIKSFNNKNILTGKNIIVGSKTLRPDGYDPTTNTVYEFNGDYWHGNPSKYNPDDKNINNNKSFGQLYLETITKENLYKKYGYTVVSIWESDFQNK